MMLPKKESYEQFEALCREVLNYYYNKNFVFYGRKGQVQHGIDLICKTSPNNCIVVQCKNYTTSTPQTLKDAILKDLNLSKQLSFHIEKFIIMTSHNRDAKIQNYFISVESDYKMEILFWEDIESIILQSPDLLKKIYPDAFQSTILTSDLNKIIENTNILKDSAIRMFENYSNYRVGYLEEQDKNLYNLCVDIENAKRSLKQLDSLYHLQLHNMKIGIDIVSLISMIPEFIEDDYESMGANLISTIFDFQRYFCSQQNIDCFILKCRRIVFTCENLYST